MTRQTLDDAGRLEALDSTNLLDTPVEEAFDRLTRLASTILNVPVSLISLVKTDRQFFKSQIGLGEPWASQRGTPISHSFCQHVIISGEPLIVEDATVHPLVCNNPAINDLGVASYLGIPLATSDGWRLGSLCIIDHEPRIWTEQEIKTMHTLAESVMAEIKLRIEINSKESLLAELKARNDELDAFAYTVSHNLKNPIAAIILQASMAKRYANRMSVEELHEAIKKMWELATQTNDIIDALLLLARVTRSDQAPQQELNMFNIIDDALSRLRPAITAKGVKVHLPDETTFPQCIGYRQWVEEVWVNYISNAIKYGGQNPVIEFGADQENDGAVRYWIKDNGIGIEHADQQSLFIPFNRLPQSKDIDGHGLGLSIVQSIIQKLGGQTGVSSSPGIGSTFSFTLPTKAPGAD